MKAQCRISTAIQQTPSSYAPLPSQSFFSLVGFSTDSKQLSSLSRPFFSSQRPPIFRLQPNGRERANSEMPATVKVFHPEAARREL